jgi:hypothetical protein
MRTAAFMLQMTQYDQVRAVGCWLHCQTKEEIHIMCFMCQVSVDSA